MSQIELNDGLAAHMAKSGDVPLNPTGKQGSPVLRMKRLEITKALLTELGEQCTVPGHENESWFRAGLLGLLRLYVEGVPWAVREVHNRAFGRVPLDVALAASLTVKKKASLSELTPEELANRVEQMARITRAAADAAANTIDGDLVPENGVENEPVQSKHVSVPLGGSPDRAQPSRLADSPFKGD